MRILIYGAGAVGGFAGGILAAAGADVTLVARGAHHDALKRRGLILEGKMNGRPDPIRVNVCKPVNLRSHQIRACIEEQQPIVYSGWSPDYRQTCLSHPQPGTTCSPADGCRLRAYRSNRKLKHLREIERQHAVDALVGYDQGLVGRVESDSANLP